MKTSIYIPDDKQQLFERAKTELGESISTTFVRCLERELEAKKLETGRIVVDIYDQRNDRRSKKAFEGRWIIGDEDAGETYGFDYEKTGVRGSQEYSVAQTVKGKLVVYSHSQGETVSTDFEVYEGFEQMRSAEDGNYPRHPESLIAAVADALEIDHIEVLDI